MYSTHVCISLLDGKKKRKNTITGEFQLCLQSGEAIVKESKDSENLLSGAITGAFVCSRPHVHILQLGLGACAYWYIPTYVYCIAGNVSGTKFSQMAPKMKIPR